MDVAPHRLALAIEEHGDLIGGQLLTPLTRYRCAGATHAIDNGAFSGLRLDAWKRLIERNSNHSDHRLFTVVPDIVGNGRRTLEIWHQRHIWPFLNGSPLALVAQDGVEDLDIPWSEMDAIFIGGGDPWKDSAAACDIVKTAKAIGIHVHVGRVNTTSRYERFARISADTCDGSGVAKYSHMLRDLGAAINHPVLFEDDA